MSKDKYVIKTGAGDFLKKRYPITLGLTFRLCFVTDLKGARKFNNIAEAEKVKKTCPFLERCQIVKI